METNSLLKRIQGTNFGHDHYFELLLEERWWRTDRLVTAEPALDPFLVLLTPKGRNWCFCWGRILLGTSSRNHTGILTATCKETSLLLQQCQEKKNKKKHKQIQTEERIRKDGQCVASPFCSHPPGFTVTWTSSKVRLITEFIWTAS